MAQAFIVQKLIEDRLGLDVEIIKQESRGDKDQISQLHTFRGQGAFTGTLERALLKNEIDIAVHSLKDLPIENTAGLYLPAYIERHSSGDVLLIKKRFVVSEKKLILKSGIRFATGSPRRQSQFLSKFPSSIPIDIRGNVNTRISRLEMSHIDALLMAKAVFERLNLIIPNNVIKIDLPIQEFPTAPGQGAIAIQARNNELGSLEKIGDLTTQLSVTAERDILKSIGGGCDIAVGISIIKEGEYWKLISTQPQSNWDFVSPVKLSYLVLKDYKLEQLVITAKNYISSLPSNSEKIPTKSIPKMVSVVSFRSLQDNINYIREIEKHPQFTVFSSAVYRYSTNFELINDDEFIKKWEETTWVVLTSQRATEIFNVVNRLYPRKAFRVAVIGKKTSQIVRSYGLPVHLVAKGSLEELKSELSRTREIYPGKVLFLSGEHITGLPSKDADRFIAYKVFTNKLTIPFKPEVIIAYSTRSAKEILLQLGDDCTKRWIAIGNSTGEYLKKQKQNVIISPSPDVEGVMKALMEVG
ncbi:MAG: hydroxymethylbilane synthase [Candidatus Heimdallarchaeota archaeon]|nr:hydroxymethylbilane synthase [Candidatus Heimdallarchaeota archaeon]